MAPIAIGNSGELQNLAIGANPVIGMALGDTIIYQPDTGFTVHLERTDYDPNDTANGVSNVVRNTLVWQYPLYTDAKPGDIIEISDWNMGQVHSSISNHFNLMNYRIELDGVSVATGRVLTSTDFAGRTTSARSLPATRHVVTSTTGNINISIIASETSGLNNPSFRFTGPVGERGVYDIDFRVLRPTPIPLSFDHSISTGSSNIGQTFSSRNFTYTFPQVVNITGLTQNTRYIIPSLRVTGQYSISTTSVSRNDRRAFIRMRLVSGSDVIQNTLHFLMKMILVIRVELVTLHIQMLSFSLALILLHQ